MIKKAKAKERFITVQVINNWRFKIDNFGNHQPIRLNTDPESKAFGEWQPVSKYFANVKQVIQYIISEELFNKYSNDDNVGIIEELNDYLFHIQSIHDNLEELVGRVVEKLK